MQAASAGSEGIPQVQAAHQRTFSEVKLYSQYQPSARAVLAWVRRDSISGDHVSSEAGASSCRGPIAAALASCGDPGAVNSVMAARGFVHSCFLPEARHFANVPHSLQLQRCALPLQFKGALSGQERRAGWVALRSQDVTCHRCRRRCASRLLITWLGDRRGHQCGLLVAAAKSGAPTAPARGLGREGRESVLAPAHPSDAQIKHRQLSSACG